MTLDQLRYFKAVATFQHVGRAATSIPISPSVISAAVHSLEEELGVELFRKEGRRIALTRDGQALLRRAGEILASVDRLPSELRGEPRALTGHYKFAASPFLASRHLADAVASLCSAHPTFTADVSAMNTAHAIAEVLSGRLDLALCFSPLQHPELKETVLLEGQLRIIVRKGHPALDLPPRKRVAFLATMGAAIHRSTPGVESCEIHPVFDRLGFQPKIRLHWDSDDIAVRAVLGGDLWALVPDLVVEAYDACVSVLPLTDTGDAPYRISAITRRERTQESAIQAILSRLAVQSRLPAPSKPSRRHHQIR